MSEPRQRRGRSKQNYQTPPEFLTAVKQRFGIRQFDIDLAAEPHNAACEHFYTEEDDALVQPWRVGNGWNWLNPPYADIRPWVHRAHQEMVREQASTLMLLPAGVGSNWFRDWAHEKAQVIFLNGRLTFVGCDTCYPKDCLLLVYQPAPTGISRGYEIWTWNP